ncbi:PREDICTED: protein-glutamine gamma-glutamyltransferase 4 [Galeopterus variegatus]|uniref:Protein-glutamine gamma-glutamyltransferase 4 n=1 Tax=Galeopterus variegatus TaxID=482537 RepID=A0ABM0QAW9_GALVR|nr:PREDICTED: protein-glutamine gamma-glutamyltransferase 4 [Galeopterus variegatus]
MELLKVLQVDFLKQKNTYSHRTLAYQTNKVVLRRGQMFHLRLVLNQPFQSSDNLELQFSMGPNPNISKLILAKLNKEASLNSDHWLATLHSHSGTEIIVAVTSAPKAMVGKYFLSVKSGNHLFKPEENILYLLFNPWCEEDVVFMPDEKERAEYVLNDTGYVYMGFAGNIREKPWNFAQFEKNVLNCCITLLSQSFVKPENTWDPVLVGRALTAVMSPQNGQGLLIGNWSGNYQGGTPPHVWTGSAPILQQYYATQKPVSFGQCWVFSGVLTTVLRALGIPARSVTNFNSAHDTEKNLTVDIYLNEMGKKIVSMSKDSVWNFHVWTEGWMKRQDLPKGYDGWQAMDGTPQELSDGIYRCGPSPLTAIRRGDISMCYDTRFLFSEVHASKYVWMVKVVNGEKKYTVISVEKTEIGKQISTKAVGQDSRNDITNEYKFPEGSSEEKEATEHAFTLLNYERKYHLPEKKDFLEMSVQADPVLLGNCVNFTLILKRTTATQQKVKIASSFDLQMYTGKMVANLGVFHKTAQIQGQESKVTVTLDCHAYMGSLGMIDDEPVVKGFFVAEIVESKEMMTSETFVYFQYPEFAIELPNSGKVGQPLTCSCVFKNTLAIPLTNILIFMESLGISSRQTFDQGTVHPGETIQFYINCTPEKTGPRKFIIKFTSDQVKEIYAEKIVLITN